MHLITLLLATVFSSQFEAPNAISELIITEGGEVTTANLAGDLPVVKMTVEGTAAGTLVWKLALDAKGTDGAIVITAQVTADSDNWKFTHVKASLSLDPLLAKGIPDKFYLVVSDGDKTFAAPITVTAAFTVDKEEIIEHETLDDIEIELTGTGWGTKSIFYAICSKAPQLATEFTTIFGTATASSDIITATIPKEKAAALLAGMVDGNIYVYAGETNAANAAKNAPVAIPVKIPAFTTDKKTLPCSLVETAAEVTLVLSEKATTKTWTTGGKLKVKIGKDASGAVTEDIADITIGATGGVATLVISEVIWGNVAFDAQTDKLFIWAQITTAPTPTTDTPAALTFDAFEMDIKTVNEVAIGLGPLTITPGVGAWDTTKNVTLKFSHELLADKEDNGFWESPEIAPEAGGTYILTTLDLKDQPIKGGGKIYVYVGTTEDDVDFVYTVEPQTIAVAAATFTVTADPAVKDSATTIAGNIVLDPVITNSLHTSGENKISIYVSLDPEADPEELTAIGTATVKGGAPAQYDFTALTLPTGMKLREDKPIQVWVSFLKKGKTAGTETWLSDKKTIAVAEDPAVLRFSVAPTTISVDDLATLETLTLTQTIGKPWTTILVALNKQGVPATAPATPVAFGPTDDVFVLTLTDDMKTLVKALVANDKLEVAVHLTGKPSYYTEKAAATITPGRLVTDIDPEAVSHDAWKANPTFEVTLKSGVPWTTATSKLVISRSSSVTTTTGTNDIVKSNLEATNSILTVALVKADIDKFLTVTPPLTVYVFVSSDGTAINAQTPATFLIATNPPKLEFAVAPKTIELTAEEITGLTITPKDATGWTSPIQFTVTDTIITPKSNDGVSVDGTAAMANNVWTATAAVDLSDFTLTDGMTIYVYSSTTNGGELLPVPDTITVGTAKVPSFAISPVETTWAAELKTPLITLTPTDVTWPTAAKDKFKAKFSFGTTPKTTEIAIAVAGSGTTYTYTIPKDTSLADLGIAETDLPATVKVDVSLESGTYMNKPVDFTVKAASKPEAAMGVSPLVSLLAALVFLFVKLF